jgi:alpha-glucuronidase
VRLGFLGALLALYAMFAAAPPARAEDGYDLWLRYRPLASPAATTYRQALGEIVAEDRSATLDVAAAELRRGLAGLLGDPAPSAPPVVLGTASSVRIAALRLPLAGLGAEGT